MATTQGGTIITMRHQGRTDALRVSESSWTETHDRHDDEDLLKHAMSDLDPHQQKSANDPWMRTDLSGEKKQTEPHRITNVMMRTKDKWAASGRKVKATAEAEQTGHWTSSDRTEPLRLRQHESVN